MDKDGWRPIAEAPRDGTEIEITAIEDDGTLFEIWPMQWDHTMRNPFFAGDQVGMWVLSDRSATWREGEGGPTHWRPHQAPAHDH